jgi:hypothetical protein
MIPHADNFRALADYLWSLPDDYEHFDMRNYLKVTEDEKDNTPIYTAAADGAQILGDCGTVGCALGHAFAAGVVPRLYPGHWLELSRKYFTEPHSDMWEWCFSPLWKNVDNTPKGAAKRIYYALEHKIYDGFTGEDVKTLRKLVTVYQDMEPRSAK